LRVTIIKTNVKLYLRHSCIGNICITITYILMS